MKKVHALRIFIKAVFFLVGLLSAGWFFMPWKQVGEAILLSVSARLSEPASLAYSTVGNVRRGFVVNNLEARNLMGMVDVYFNTITIVPDAAASLLSMAPTCRVAFTGATIGGRMPGVALGNGRVVVSANRQGIFLDGLRSDGELSMGGSLLANPSTGRIVWADVAMDVRSEAFEENLPIIASLSGLPLHQEGAGRWLLRRSRNE